MSWSGRLSLPALTCGELVFGSRDGGLDAVGEAGYLHRHRLHRRHRALQQSTRRRQKRLLRVALGWRRQKRLLRVALGWRRQKRLLRVALGWRLPYLTHGLAAAYSAELLRLDGLYSLKQKK